jgi:hypothetical protein
MQRQSDKQRSGWAWAGVVLLLAAALLALVDALAGGFRPWLDMGVGLAGAAALAVAGLGRLRSPWALVAGGAAVAYLTLSTAPTAVSGDAMPVVRMLVSVAALGAYLAAALPLGHLPQYGLCCAALGVGAAFFLAWEPPPPKPVPIARPLIGLRDDLLAKMPEWEGEHEVLDPAIEDMLGADAYLNLSLRSRPSPYRVQVFVAYNANAMTNIPHVPWVCMTQSGFQLVELRQDDVPHPAKRGRELKANVILFHPGEGMEKMAALMFQYFNVGGTYEANRSLARIRATSGAIGRRGSYLTQTQVSVFLPMTEAKDAMDRSSRPYTLGRTVLETLIPLLEQKYYPDLDGSEGGA